MGLLLVFLFTALGVSFTCSVLEAVLLSSPMSFVSMLEREGRPGAALLKKYKQDIDKPISAILTLNTIAHTVGATGVGVQSEVLFGSEYFALTSAILTLLILVLSEILPKTIGATYWRQLAIPAARVIHVMVILTYPFVLMSEFITRMFSSNKQTQSVSREEVSAMVTVGAEEGVFEKKENSMIQNLLKLDDIKARDIMTPSSVVEMAEESMSLREFYQNEAFRTYSRIPVYNEENDDYIKGYVLRQSILERLTEDKFDLRLSDIVRPILTFQETEPVSNIWEKLLAKKSTSPSSSTNTAASAASLPWRTLLKPCSAPKLSMKRIKSPTCKSLPAKNGKNSRNSRARRSTISNWLTKLMTEMPTIRPMPIISRSLHLLAANFLYYLLLIHTETERTDPCCPCLEHRHCEPCAQFCFSAFAVSSPPKKVITVKVTPLYSLS